MELVKVAEVISLKIKTNRYLLSQRHRVVAKPYHYHNAYAYYDDNGQHYIIGKEVYYKTITQLKKGDLIIILEDDARDYYYDGETHYLPLKQKVDIEEIRTIYRKNQQ